MSRDGWARKRANGGYMAAKVSKLDEQFKHDVREKQKQGKCTAIFSGVAIYVNGYTEPNADELRRLMSLHGGQFHVYYSRSKTTHIIANNLPNSKIQELKGEKIMRPEWITDSIKAGRLLPHLQYQLYTKHKGPLFPGQTLRQASEIPGTSHRPHSVTSHEKFSFTNQTTINPVPRRGHYQCNVQPQSSHHNEASDNDLFECSIKSPEVKPPVHLTKPDPYEFPHSPPKQSKHSPVCVEPTSCKDKEQPLKPPPSHQDAEKSSSTDLITKQLELAPRHDSHRDKTSLAPRHSALLHSSSLTSKLHSPVNRPSTSSPLSKSPSQLLVQTGDLISEYYSRSRLHQISTWRNGFSEYVNELHCKRKAAGGASFPGKERLRKSLASYSSDCKGTSSSSSSKRMSCIFHVDMDCFFVSVGIRHRPELKGKPVAVTSNRGHGRVPPRPGANLQVEQQYYQRKHNSPQPGLPDSPTNGLNQDAAMLSMAEIASCSYEARQAGVKNGMFFGKAKQVCPSLQSVPYDFEAYKEVALTMYEILASYTHDIEALSCDEVLIDASALLAELGIDAEDLAKAIRADIKEKTGCCASVGMGSNILLARLATRKAKPDGQYFLRSEEVDDFIRDLPVTSLPGVGPVMGRKLAAMSVKSCGDLQQVSMNQLQKKFGPRTGQTLFRFCRGLDDRLVRYEKERKSVSADVNYNIRFKTNDEAECFLTNLAMEVHRRLQEAGLQGRRVTLRVMVRKPGAPVESAKYGGHGICDNWARTVMLAQSTDSGQLIASAVIKLFHAMKLPVQDLRGVGIQVQLLEGNQPVRHEATGRGALIVKISVTCPADISTNHDKTITTTLPSSSTPVHPRSPEPVPGTSKAQETPKLPRKNLNLSIEVPSPSQVDRSVLEALPPELREQVEQSWMHREGRPNGTLVLQIPNQPDGLGIVLELPHLSQVGLLSRVSVYICLRFVSFPHLHDTNADCFPLCFTTVEQKNPLLQLKQAGPGIGRVKRRYKRKNAASPVKRRSATNSPAKPASPLKTSRETSNTVKVSSLQQGNCLKLLKPSTSSSKPDVPEPQPKFIPRPAPSLAGACELTDIKILLREWITTITEPMEEDILQVVKYCTDLIEDKDLEKLDLVIKYMKRLMQQSVESVWSMAFDFIVDNVQVVVQQTYGSTLKIT
uniref:DNA repair protein REV1 n=1 Tax=Cynoglossus semilaevis TaxID=244447 RepID=A0A3P8V145_CYNSE